MNLTMLKNRMSELNMTAAQLIRESGVSESTIKRIMRGKTDVHTSTLRMIATALKLDPASLIDEEADTPVSFNPSNAPEISAQILEEMTEIVQNNPEIIQINPDSDENDRSDSEISEECEIFYERMIRYLRDKLDAAHAASEQIRLQNTELVKSNTRLLDQEAATRARNRSLYVAIIIASVVAGLCFSGLMAYFVYDIMSPTWGIVRY